MLELESPSATPPPPPALPADNAVNILLVDDEPRNLDVLESILQAPGRHLIRAESASDALLALIHHDFAAIILDVQLPGMTGFELAQLVKQRRRSRHIPIIFLTAYYHETKDVITGYDAGAVDYLTKPIDPFILKSKVNVFVDLYRTTRALAVANLALEHEIAERRHAQLALARLAAIVESSADAILSMTFEGMITSWNAGAERIFGYTAGEMVGRPASLLVPPDRAGELDGSLEELKCGNGIETIETVRRCKDGRLIDVSLTQSPVRDDTGTVIGSSSILRDISERKRLEAEVLQASEREQCRIAQDLHDGVGQQLAGISCLSNTLMRDLAARRSPHASAAAKISKLLDVAVAQMRGLARGLHPVAPEPNGLMVSLVDLAAHVSDLFKVNCRFECPVPVLLEDYTMATHLYRIAQEGVTNAVKNGRAQHIEIGLSRAMQQIILTVDDDGAGFTQNPHSRKGLGMRIMNYRARMVGGLLVFMARAGGGTHMSCAVLDHRAAVGATEAPLPAEAQQAAS